MEIRFNWTKIFDAEVKIHLAKENMDVVCTLTPTQMYDIKNYVRACELAEYIKENYVIETDTIAIDLGIQIRDLILDDDIPEDEAICEILDKYGYLDKPRLDEFEQRENANE